MKKKCSVDECERDSRTRGLCPMHYSRFRRTGKTESSRPWDAMTLEERFWAKAQKAGDEECWIWTGAKQPSGHGRFRADGKTHGAYRWLWERLNGPVPNGLVLDHVVCDNPACVNPKHLAPATIGQNVLRGESESARHSRQLACHKGHPLSGSNLRIADRSAKGRGIERVCIECANARRRKAQA